MSCDRFGKFHQRSNLDPVILADYFGKGFCTGFLIGGYLGSRKTNLQFLAENQHYLPLRSRNEAVMYLRDRNYKVMSAFGSSGFKRGFQVGAICFMFKILRESLGNFEYIPNDLVASSACGCILFLLIDKRNRMHNFTKGLRYGFISGCLITAIEKLKVKLFKL